MYLLLEILGFGISKLPDRGIYLLAQFLTCLGFSVFRVRRAIVLKNLAIAFPDYTRQQCLAVGRESYLNFMLTVLEFLRGKYVDLARSVRFEGKEHLQRALDQGRGVYILCMHMGNWEAMGAGINLAITPARVVVKNVGSPAVNRWVNEVRRKNGFEVILRKNVGDGTRAILRTLKDGDIVGFVMDQSRPGEPKIPFFGTPAKTNTSFAALWRKRPAPIIPSYSFRTNVGEHVIRFEPELILRRADNQEADLIVLSEQFNRALEKMISEKPEHYFWLHNRWKQ